MTNSKVLKTKIKEKGLKLKFLSEKIGITYYSLALKISNKQEFKASEIQSLCELLDISNLKERENIFFANNVD